MSLLDQRISRPLVHLPAGADPRRALPLVCMLHGCTQDPAGFAAATRMNEAADRHGFAVVYPGQSRAANPQGCWNWFEPAHQARGAGEPAAIAALVRELVGTTTEQAIDARRVFVCGLSAGGAMANVLAAAYPDLFAAVAAHSGLAFRAAAGVGAAFAAMARGGGDPVAGGRAAHAAMGRHARAVPAMVVHGAADRTVAPVNAEETLRQWMTANALAGVQPAGPERVERGRAAGGHGFTRRRWSDDRGGALCELLIVDGLGHAWSGGAVGGSFADPRGPDAAEAIWRFFAEVSP